MEKRRFGRTGHDSTLAVFGAVALGQINQTLADKVIQQVIDSGVNHIDIAPSYGDAEARLGPWMPNIRNDFFLGCKTTERKKEHALREFHESLQRLQVEYFDLYQLHAVTSIKELNACTAKGGALDGILEMREQGLTRFIGITGHGMEAPVVFLEALDRFDFDSLLFPINPTLFANADYRRETEKLLDLCEERDVGVMTIKSIAREPWGDRPHTYHTWYLPFEEQAAIQENVNFVLSQKLAHLCTAGDYRILPKVLKACEAFEPMAEAEQQRLMEKRSELENIF
jgi:predicted aldo/keto reductase-like oxidoreductase